MCRANFAVFAFFAATNTRANSRADIPKPSAHFASLRLCVETKYDYSPIGGRKSRRANKLTLIYATFMA
jgi:hypothetical protein